MSRVCIKSHDWDTVNEPVSTTCSSVYTKYLEMKEHSYQKKKGGGGQIKWHHTSLILSRFSLTSGSSGSPSPTPTTLGMGTGGKGLGPGSFFFRSSMTLFFSVWISACSSSRDFLSFSFASWSARSWSARILSRRLSSSSLSEQKKKQASFFPAFLA